MLWGGVIHIGQVQTCYETLWVNVNQLNSGLPLLIFLFDQSTTQLWHMVGSAGVQARQDLPSPLLTHFKALETNAKKKKRGMY